ncbi:zf-HC2 domain-containing protein [Diplocloster modestus]|uniref:Anti-sigma-W factor RsiW n=1 Tax=Diplocloster modestus TaxID=2850322 RepID=A0ABS6K7U6_9FIRM|nr:zf-HC2 domain-containing protein [Diplocloster modestus]MBU9726582.1 zf-HC2 domain-containing protein [Diplocloster modestus]
MKITCAIIQDLLPLYVENVASEDTCLFVEDHVSTCKDCREQLQEMRLPAKLPADQDISPFLKLKTTLWKKKMQTIFFTCLAALALAVAAIAYLVSPVYLPYEKQPVTLSEREDNALIAVFNKEATGYGVSSSPSDDGSGYVYHIVAWDSIWNSSFVRTAGGNTVLNPNGEKISAVYYYETNGTGEKLLYGDKQNPSGMLIRQPKLSVCLLASLTALFLGGVLFLIFRKNTGVRKILFYMIPLPVFYLLSHFLILGTTVTSYSAMHDLLAVLLVTMLFYVIYGIARCLFHYIRNKSAAR